MYKSYFFLGLGVGLIISGSVFMFFSNKTDKTPVKPETEFVQTEKKESPESEEFKKLLREIEELKETEDKTESSEAEGDNLADSSTEDSGEESDNKKEEEKAEKETVTEKKEEAKIEEKKEVITKVTETIPEKKIEEEKPKEIVKKKEEIKKAVKGKITILEDKKNNTEYKATAEKYQIQFRSSKNSGDCERIKDILKDVIDSEIIFLAEYYRVFSSEMFSKEIAYDVADKIGKIYNLKPIVWFSDYTLIFKEDKNIKNCEILQKRIAQYIDTTIKFENNVYVLSTKNPLPKNLAVDIAEYINEDIALDVIIKQSV